MSSSSTPPFVLHTTPPLGDLPGSDPTTLYYASLLQLVEPGRWTSRQGDWGSNRGDLPYMTHLGRTIQPRHLHSLPAWSDPDDDLDQDERCEALMWRAYIEGNLTDLANHTLYSLPPNYPSLLVPAQSATLGSLERHYIPQRLRSIHRSRLEHVGLWGLGGLNAGDAVDEDRKRLEEAFIIGPGGTVAPRAWSGWKSGRESEKRRRMWGEEEIVKRARGVLDPLSRRLGEGSYFFRSRPSSADLLLFAHLSLLLTPAYPNPLLPDLIRSSYPSLATHHNRLLTLLFPRWTIPRVPAPPAPSWSKTISSWWNDSASSGSQDGGESEESPASGEMPGRGRSKGKGKSKTDAERRFERGRWLWYAGTAVAMVGYLFASGMLKIEFVGDDEVETDDEEDEDEDEEEEAEEEGEEESEGEEEEVLEEEEVVILEDNDEG